MRNSFVEENKKMSDDEIISRFRSNDFDSIQLIIDRYMPLVVSTAKSFNVSPFETEEIIAEGFLAVFKAVKNYDSKKSKFSTFVSLCVRRAMADEIKSSSRAKRIPSDMIDSISDIDLEGTESPEDIVIDRENLIAFKENLSSFLSRTELSVLSLFLEGNSYTDISEKLSISQKSVDNALSRVRNKLKKQINGL